MGFELTMTSNTELVRARFLCSHISSCINQTLRCTVTSLALSSKRGNGASMFSVYFDNDAAHIGGPFSQTSHLFTPY